MKGKKTDSNDVIADGVGEEVKDYWCKLVSKTSRVNSVFVTVDAYTIGRGIENNLAIKDGRISANHCCIIRVKKEKDYEYILEDNSSNGTFLNGTKVGKKNKVPLKNSDEIMLLNSTQVAEEETIGFVFTLADREIFNSGKRKNSAADALESEAKRAKLDEDYSKEMECGMCIELMYQAVTVMPCLHNFCGACYSDWMEKSSICPGCRNPVSEVKKSSTINNLIEKYLAKHPEKKRTKEDCDDMEARNKITAEVMKVASKPPEEKNQSPVRGRGRGRGRGARGRGRAVPVEEEKGFHSSGSASDQEEDKKEEQKKESPSKKEKCSTCNKLKISAGHPARSCVECSLRVCEDCGKDRGFERLDKRKVASLPPEALKEIPYEQQVLREYITDRKINIQDVYNASLAELVAKRTKVKSKKEYKNEDVMCSKCFLELLNELMYKYRESIHSFLPKEIKERPNCWYGPECRTQGHNSDHAKKYNHVCEKKPGK